MNLPIGLRVGFGFFGMVLILGMLWGGSFSLPVINISMAISGIIMLVFSFGLKAKQPFLVLCIIGIICQIIVMLFSYPVSVRIDSYGAMYSNLIVIILYFIGLYFSLNSKSE